MRCLGIDQSLTGCGIVLVEFANKKAKIISSDTVKSKKSGTLRLIEIRDRVIESIKDQQLDCGARENYAWGAKGRATFSIGELGGALDISLHEHNFIHQQNYYLIHNTSWKKFFLGKGNVKKDTQYLMTIYKALGIQFANDNESDAYCLAVMAGYIHSIRKRLLPFSQLPEHQQVCLLDLKKLTAAGTTQMKAMKEFDEQQKLNCMLDF